MDVVKEFTEHNVLGLRVIKLDIVRNANDCLQKNSWPTMNIWCGKKLCEGAGVNTSLYVYSGD